MEFSVEPEVFVCFPGMRLAVVVAHDVDNELGSGLSRDFGATVHRFVVDAAAPRISW